MMALMVSPDPDVDPSTHPDLVDLGTPVEDGDGALTPDAAAEDITDGEGYTIDELAALSGVPSRTIRFYQSKGTLPAPERRGRVAYYGPDHVERLRIIGELQDRGLRLDTIRDALTQVEQGGDSLQNWLGVGDRLQAPWSDDKPIVLDEADLLDRLGETGQRPGLLGDLQRLGLIERQGHSRPATYVVPSPGLLDIGLQLEAAGIDAATAFEAGEVMRIRLARMTDELVKYFADRAGQGFGGAGDPEDIALAFEALRPTGLQAVQLIFAQEMERSLREFVERGGAMRAVRRRDDERDPREGRSSHRSSRKPGRR
jgi:DNA-binding transcriptional MerR regulator